MFEWDESKHGIDFSLLEDMDWANARRIEDGRQEYGETRYIAMGYIEERLFVCVYTERGKNRRIISLRKANPRERRIYEKEIIDE